MEFFDPNTHKPKNPEDPKLNKDFFAMTEESLNVLKNKVSSIDESKLSPEQKTIFQSAKESIKSLTSKVVKTVGWITFIAGTFTAVNYERTHSDLEITTNQDGTHEYKHEDARTTHLLNVIGGKEKINEEDMRIDYNNNLEYACKIHNIKKDKKIQDMTIDELDKFIVENQERFDIGLSAKIKIGDFKKEFYEEIENSNNVDTNLAVPNKDIYELVWKLENECGNPKIRFISENREFTPLSSYNNSNHYDFLTNTIYVYLWSIRSYTNYPSENYIISELSHAKQNNDNPIGLELRYIKDLFNVLKNSDFSAKSISKQYGRTYHNLGTVEHEAHSVIEPYLKSKYPLFIKKDNKEKKDE